MAVSIHAHTIIAIVYIVLAVPAVAWFIVRRKHEPIRSRGWYLAVTSVVYGGFMICSQAAAAEIQIANGSTPCNLVIWPFAPFTCFFLNVRADGVAAFSIF